MQEQANRRRLAVADRRAEIVAAAVRLLGKRSPDGLSLPEVAAEAGASRALVYHYFRDRRTLYSAAIRAVADDLLRRLRPAGLHPLDQLQESVAGYVSFADEHADGLLAILRGSAAADTDAEASMILDRVRHAVLDLVAHTLDIERPSVTLRLSSNAWVSFAQQMSLEWLSDRELTTDELHRLLVRHLLATLAVAADSDEVLRAALDDAVATSRHATVPRWLAQALEDTLLGRPATSR